jgi:hypothetical protein
VDVADNLIGVAFAACGSVQVGNRSVGHLQALKLLLCNRVGNRPHVALDLSFAKRGPAAHPFMEHFGVTKRGMKAGRKMIYPEKRP